MKYEYFDIYEKDVKPMFEKKEEKENEDIMFKAEDDTKNDIDVDKLKEEIINGLKDDLASLIQSINKKEET